MTLIQTERNKKLFTYLRRTASHIFCFQKAKRAKFSQMITKVGNLLSRVIVPLMNSFACRKKSGRFAVCIRHKLPQMSRLTTVPEEFTPTLFPRTKAYAFRMNRPGKEMHPTQFFNSSGIVANGLFVEGWKKKENGIYRLINRFFGWWFRERVVFPRLDLGDRAIRSDN